MKYYVMMHVVIFIWGFTGVIGELLEHLPAQTIVFYRMLIGTISIGLFILIFRRKFSLGKGRLWQSGLTGLIIAAHWITFFLSIHYSNVSFALILFSTTSLFTSFLEPLLMRKRFSASELVMGVLVIAGISVISYDAIVSLISDVQGMPSNVTEPLTGLAPNYPMAILCALISAFLAAFFSVLNAIYVRDSDSVTITFVELAAGAIGLAIFYGATGELTVESLTISTSDFYLLLLLGVVCTAFAFFMGNWLMKFITPFTMNLNINMEPIYAIILALIIFGQSEVMSVTFYLGATLIIGAIVMNAWWKGRKAKRSVVSDVLDDQ